MAFAFAEKDKSTGKAVRRIARDRLSGSLALIADPSRPRAEVVHELRKNVKKTRALLRLVRPHLKHFKRENAALRGAGRVISELRDADVLAETFDAVARRACMPPAALAELREAIVRPRSAATGAGDRLRAHAEAIAAIEARTKHWKIGETGFDALSGGLERTWDAARKAMRAAEADPTGAALHLWRKRIKDHWHHARLLAPIWPEMMRPHVAAAGTLEDALGDARDLAFLIEALEGLDRGAEIRALAEQDAARLLADAHALGTRFLSEPASGLAKRWRGWWEIWRAR